MDLVTDALKSALHIVQVDGPHHFPRIAASPDHNVLHGWAVRGTGSTSTPWLWFTSAEPAYACGRALRMAGSISSWDMNRAALEVRFDQDAPEFERRKLYIDWHPAPERDDDDLVIAFAKGISKGSSGWPHSTQVDHHVSA